MSILSTSPTNMRCFDMEIANALGSFEAALILQQLHYWMKKKGVGVVVNNAKYIYNTFKQWVNQQFTFLTEWKFRNGMNILRSLKIVEVIRYKSKQWNQTNYYSLNYERLREWSEAESIEISELWSTSPQDDETQTLKMGNPNISLNEPKITDQRRSTAKQTGDRHSHKSSSFAAADSKEALEEEKEQKQSNLRSAEVTAVPSQNKDESEAAKTDVSKETNIGKVDYIVNSKWRSLIPLLDSIGVPINKTIKDLLKLYPSEKVEGAIALLKARKREQHIPNPSGYFVSALKGDWGSQNLVGGESNGNSEEIDKGAVFRHWYDLARELGYCSGQEIRSGEQWICLSGAWEKWSAAVERGYSLEYLKKIIKRNNQ